ncbi:MAG: iron-sulfur cluster-binding oxidoreductase [bacterium]|nr:MAG: iron-sulfur cluster-binding oxidoreductase [bacterium]
MKDLACGCPGSHVRTINRPETDQPKTGNLRSELRQWPTQLTLVPPTAPWLQDADLLVVADCVPMAYADFHRDFIRGRVLVQACPKLDDCGPYVGKLTAMLEENDIRSVTVPIMEVPCCRGLAVVVQQAIAASGKDIPLETVIVGVDGERRN